MIDILLVLLFSSLTILIHGYQFGVADQTFYLSLVAKAQDPTLFSNDYLFSKPQPIFSFFEPLIVFLDSILPGSLQITFLLVYLPLHFLLFVIVFKISFLLFKNRLAAFLALTLLAFPKNTLLSGIMTFESYLTPRMFGNFFFLLFLYFILNRHFVSSAFSASFGFLLHPISLVYSLFIYPFFIGFFERKDRVKNLFVFGGIFVLFCGWFVIWGLKNLEGNPIFVPSDWLSIIQFRTPRVFPSFWPLFSWLNILSLILMFSSYFFFKNRFKKININDRKIIAPIFLGAFFFIFHFFFAQVIPISFVIQLQLIRFSLPLLIIAIVLYSYFLVGFFPKVNLVGKAILFFSFLSLFLPQNPFAFWAILLTFFTVIFFEVFKKKREELRILDLKNKWKPILFLLIFLLSSVIIIRGQLFNESKLESDWKEAQIWARKNSAQDSIFLVPPDHFGFRTNSNRAIVGEFVDGFNILYSYPFAKEWKKGMDDLEEFDNFDEKAVEKLRGEYHFNYLIWPTKNRRLDFPAVFANNSFIVYQIN